MHVRRRTILTIAATVCFAVGIGCSRRATTPQVTDRALLREAIAEWQHAGNPWNGGAAPEILAQQARQGYYDDAVLTARLIQRWDKSDWPPVRLAAIRAANGDVPGARAMLAQYAGSTTGAEMAKEAGRILACRGDLPDALETVAMGVDRDDILLDFARHQIAYGEFAAALETAAQMKSPNNVFFDIGEALQERHQQMRVRELASGMTDQKLAAQFRREVRSTLWPPTWMEVQTLDDPCSHAAAFADKADFTQADAVVEQNHCTSVYYVARLQYASDPAGAERLLRTYSKPEEFHIGLEELTLAAARKGNIPEALRFLGELQNRKDAEGRVEGAIREITRCWTAKDGVKPSLQWARSRPSGLQRSWALLGVAEALAPPGKTEPYIPGC
jgi:hypothetical protein